MCSIIFMPAGSRSVAISDGGVTDGGRVTEGDESDAVLLADVGGTNVRFAVLGRAGLGPVAHMAVNDYQNFADGLAAFTAKSLTRRPSPVDG